MITRWPSPASWARPGRSHATDGDAIAAVQADVALDSSGNARGLASAIRGTARGGRVVMVGLLPTGDQPVPMSLAITRELELVGSFRFNDEIDAVIAALADGSLDIDPVLTHEFPAAGHWRPSPSPRTPPGRPRFS